MSLKEKTMMVCLGNKQSQSSSNRMHMIIDACAELTEYTSMVSWP